MSRRNTCPLCGADQMKWDAQDPAVVLPKLLREIQAYLEAQAQSQRFDTDADDAGRLADELRAIMEG